MKGAIEGMSASGSELSVRTIGGADAVGICGSGLVDALAVMRNADVLDETGRLVGHDEKSPVEGLGRRVVRGLSGPEFVIVEGGRNRRACRCHPERHKKSLQLAKGAITAGIKIMLARMGVNEADLKEVLLAGAFGNYIDKANARCYRRCRTFLDLIKPVGNAAGVGAKHALLSKKLQTGGCDGPACKSYKSFLYA